MHIAYKYKVFVPKRILYLISRDDRAVGSHRKMDTRVGHQIGLELIEVHINCTIESERCSDGGNDLCNQPVQVGVRWPRYVQVGFAQIIDGLIVH